MFFIQYTLIAVPRSSPSHLSKFFPLDFRPSFSLFRKQTGKQITKKRGGIFFSF